MASSKQTFSTRLQGGTIDLIRQGASQASISMGEFVERKLTSKSDSKEDFLKLLSDQVKDITSRQKELTLDNKKIIEYIDGSKVDFRKDLLNIQEQLKTYKNSDVKTIEKVSNILSKLIEFEKKLENPKSDIEKTYNLILELDEKVAKLADSELENENFNKLVAVIDKMETSTAKLLSKKTGNSTSEFSEVEKTIKGLDNKLESVNLPFKEMKDKLDVFQNQITEKQFKATDKLSDFVSKEEFKEIIHTMENLCSDTLLSQQELVNYSKTQFVLLRNIFIFCFFLVLFFTLGGFIYFYFNISALIK